MSRVIILDGPDMCGKTEIAKNLSKVLGVPYYKNENEWSAFEGDPAYFQNALKYGDSYFYDFLLKTKTSVILDRSFPSEWVYSQVFNRPRDPEVLRHIDNIASQAGAKIVIAHRKSYSGICDNMHSIDSTQLAKIHEYYEKFAEWTNCETLLLPVDDEDLDRETNDIIDFVYEENANG